MTPTPLTDAELDRMAVGGCPGVVTAGFATNLERQLNEAKAAIELGKVNCDVVYNDLKEQRDEMLIAHKAKAQAVLADAENL